MLFTLNKKFNIVVLLCECSSKILSTLSINLLSGVLNLCLLRQTNADTHLVNLGAKVLKILTAWWRHHNLSKKNLRNCFDKSGSFLDFKG